MSLEYKSTLLLLTIYLSLPLFHQKQTLIYCLLSRDLIEKFGPNHVVVGFGWSQNLHLGITRTSPWLKYRQPKDNYKF